MREGYFFKHRALRELAAAIKKQKNKSKKKKKACATISQLPCLTND